MRRSDAEERVSFRRVLKGEAVAYVRSGFYAAADIARRRVSNTNDAGGELGVLFVHGVGANRSQFIALERALEGSADRLDHFEYRSVLNSLDRVLLALDEQVRASSSERIVLVGHSLGGLLVRLLLQSEDPPPRIAGFVSICAPLHGTAMSALGFFSPALRAIAPHGARIREQETTRHRLDRWRGSILTIGSTRDHFVLPSSSAFLEEHETMRLHDTGHVGALFDPRVHAAIRSLLDRVRNSEKTA